MSYISTRGAAAPVSFVEAALAGPAPDGGLWVPARWPEPPADAFLPAVSFPEVAARVMAPFAAPELSLDTLRGMTSRAFAGFAHPAVAPLRQIGPRAFVLELFHGPTLAFKDVALSVMAEIWDHALANTGKRMTAIVATSGDTGGAAVHALAGRAQVDLIALHPYGRITEVQRRFMTTADAPNIFNIAIDGDFDAAQGVVKALFADQAFSARAGLMAVNSINWARIAAQASYYVAAGLALGWPAAPPTYVAPTGNFGDALAGFVAHKLGAPMAGVVIASNANDVLPRAFATGRYARRASLATIAPAMDIQAPSNFERLVFELLGRDGAATAALYKQFAETGGFDLPEPARAQLNGFWSAAAADDAAISRAIAAAYKTGAGLVCPHTAAGLACAPDAADAPVITLATAHPAKFPEAVKAATGVTPELPERVGNLFARRERFDVLPADLESIKRYIAARSRAFA